MLLTPEFIALRRAIKNFGTQARMAEHFGLTQSAVQQWRKAPAERALEIEKLTGVSRHELRPDLYPRAGEAA